MDSTLAKENTNDSEVIDSSTNTSNKAKKRWRLLRHVSWVTRRTSLTKSEAKFLAVNVKDCEKNEKASQDNSAGDQKTVSNKSWEKLCEIVKEKKKFCTKKEEAFLSNLIKNKVAYELSEEQIEHVEKVLEDDLLFNDDVAPQLSPEEDESSQALDGANAADSSKEKQLPKEGRVIAKDASFRKELWTEFKPEYFSQSSGATESQKDDDSTLSNECIAKEDSCPWFFPAIMNNLFNPIATIEQTVSAVEEVEEKEQNENVDDEWKQCIGNPIIATSENDEDCFPHVLSPPIMLALRPYLPYAIQQDNFWLKYSMQRDHIR